MTDGETLASPEPANIEGPEFHLGLGRRLWREQRYRDAANSFARALDLDPASAVAHNNLGWAREEAGDESGALYHYGCAVELSPGMSVAKVNLAKLLAKAGRHHDAEQIWLALVAVAPGDPTALENLVHSALRAGDLETASAYAERIAVTHHGRPEDTGIPPRSRDKALSRITIPKLRHDIEQFAYLQSQGILAAEAPALIDRYQRVLSAAESRYASGDQWYMTEAERTEIGAVYKRILYRPDAPRVRMALSDSWSRASAECAYLEHPLGVVVVDDFLSADALKSLRRFCLESTIWFANRYAYGRLGTTFRRGFSSPLLTQIAEELATAFPALIGSHHRLLQMWAFKYSPTQPATSAHADFAAVNVNFWITPDESNLDPAAGGITIYDVEAPLSWDFDAYNKQGGKIGAFLREHSAEPVAVPYRSNRAVIFNSDLFHTTQPLRFRDGYQNRRINVTLLYGTRDKDLRHSDLDHSRSSAGAG
jgi:tetratricopeptide (TPR) repeat protein